MIPHFKALIKSSLNQKRKWTWHHCEVGHTHLIEKATPLLKLVWSLSWSICSHFRNCVHLPLFMAFFWGIYLILNINWLKNNRSSNFDEKTFWSVFLFLVGLHVYTVLQYKEKFAINNFFYCSEALVYYTTFITLVFGRPKTYGGPCTVLWSENDNFR